MKPDKLYVYEIGYGSPEDSGYHQLYHTEKYNDEQLADLVSEAVVAVIAHEKEDDPYLHSYAGIHVEVGDWLINNRGFVAQKPEASWHCFGWASIFVHGDWKTYRSGDEDALARLVDKVREAGYTEADDSYFSKRKGDKI
jgi:hypothetical protein